MMLNSAATLFIPVRPPRRIMCFASTMNTTTEQLRIQLDQLHSEAQTTRSKANNARLRLMRLSEAAEKLRRQASISVQTGKENDARDLLFQKKKVMQALEKSKSRVELLDELAKKLNEAISVKETQLIGTVASDFQMGTEPASSPVRVISPKQEVTEEILVDASETSVDENFILKDNHKLQNDDNEQKQQMKITEQENNKICASLKTLTGQETVSILTEISSYKEFLEHLDRQLNDIEAEVVTVLRLSSLILESQEKTQNTKVKETVEILDSVRCTRKRIQEAKRRG